MKYERVLSTSMEAVYGYFRPEEIQQTVSNVLEEIEKLGNGESRIKIGHQGITEDEFIANMNAAIKEGFPYEGDIISHYICEINNLKCNIMCITERTNRLLR